MLWILGSALAGTCDPAPIIAETLANLSDLEQAESGLVALEGTLGCRRAEPSTLATLWLIEAVVLRADADLAGQQQALAAARGIAPDFWHPSFDEPLRRAWEQAVNVGEGRLALSTPLPSHATLFVDGEVTQAPAQVPSGLHAVQIEVGGQIIFGDVVYVPGGGTRDVGVPLIAPLAVPDPEPLPRPDRSSRLGPWVAVGLDAAVGRALEADDRRQPALRLGPTLEVGLHVPLGGIWLEAGLGAHLLAGGSYLAVDEQGTLKASPLGLQGFLGIGVGGPQRLGLQVGVSAPSRRLLRLDGSVPVGPLRLHLRPGVALVNGGPESQATVEPTLQFLVGLRGDQTR